MIRKTNRPSALVIAFLVVASVFGAGSMAGFAGAQESSETTEIDSCTTITESGIYTLTEDIENADAETCIAIEASDVVFDGAGHTVDGVDGEGTAGIRAEFVDRVTVRDVTVTDWTFGVEHRSDADDGIVREVVARSNGLGISVSDANNATVTDSKAVENEGIGVDFFVSSANTVTDTVARNNGGPGFSFDDSSTNTVENATATDNDGAGFLFDESGRNTVTNVVATGNQQGFDLSLAGNTTIENARVTNNTGAAFESDDVLGLSPETNTARNFETDSATISFTEIKDTSEFRHALAIDAVASPPDDPDDLRNIGQHVEVNESAPDAAPSVELDVQYTDTDVEAAGVSEESLRLYTYADGEWTEVPDSSVDTEANVVSGNLTDVDESVVVAPLGQPADDGDETDDGGDGADDTSDGDDSPADATALALGETASGTVGPDDEADWYAVDLDAGQTVTVTGTDEASDTTLTAYGPTDGPETVEESDLTEIDSQGLTILEETLFEFTAEESGTHYFAVTDDENDGDEPFDAYEFTVTAVNDGDDGDDSDGGDGSEDGDQRDEDAGGDGADGQNGSDDEQADGDGEGAQGGDNAPKTDDGSTDDGTDGSADQNDSADESDGSGGVGTEKDDREGDDALFGEPITAEFAGISLTFGPPTDPDGDSVYEDVTGDGEVDLFDAFAHAVVVTAANGDTLDLSDEQASALDIDDDGTLTYGDALALADGTNAS